MSSFKTLGEEDFEDREEEELATDPVSKRSSFVRDLLFFDFFLTRKKTKTPPTTTTKRII